MQTWTRTSDDRSMCRDLDRCGHWTGAAESDIVLAIYYYSHFISFYHSSYVGREEGARRGWRVIDMDMSIGVVHGTSNYYPWPVRSAATAYGAGRPGDGWTPCS